MSTPSYRAAQLGGTADEVEAAFYEALQRGDLEQLMACWADEDDIFCVHPGGPRQVGAPAIRHRSGWPRACANCRCAWIG